MPATLRPISDGASDCLPVARAASGFASLQAFSSNGWFIVPSGVSRAKVTVIGGGGAGGMHAALPGGGGGAGGRAVRVLTGSFPAQRIS